MKWVGWGRESDEMRGVGERCMEWGERMMRCMEWGERMMRCMEWGEREGWGERGMGRERGMGSIRMMTLCVINYDRSQGHMRKGMSVVARGKRAVVIGAGNKGMRKGRSVVE